MSGIQTLAYLLLQPLTMSLCGNQTLADLLWESEAVACGACYQRL